MEQSPTKLPIWHNAALDLIRKYGGTSPQSGSDRPRRDWNAVRTTSRNSRSPCRNFLKGRCHLGASCKRLHPVNTYKHGWSAEQHPMIAGEQYFHRGSWGKGANSRPITVYEKHHQGILPTPRDHAENVVMPNTVNQNGVELSTGGHRFGNPTQRNEIVNLWSRPFKRWRSCPKDNVRCETLRRDYSLGNHHRSRWPHESQNQFPGQRSFEKPLISEMNTATVGLGKCEMTGVNVDLNHELNENPEKPEQIVKVYSRKKRVKQDPSTCKCDIEPMMEQATDTKSQSLTISTSVEGAPLDHKNEDTKRHCGETLLPILKSKRKLLVLDVNGLLADIVVDFPDTCKPDTTVGGKGVFKRPFCDDFLHFCFEKFDVGIWSSRTKKNVTMVLDCLMEKTKDRLLFCWHQSHCTQTGYYTVENHDKPLVLKELKKLWEKEEDCLPWKKGFYDETNTILLDDSPHKALRNPPYTAVFPCPYTFNNVQDKSLGPDGDLRLYLERLVEAENVQKFIKENPFGQRPITKTNLSWTFYSRIAGEYARQQDSFANSSSHFTKLHHACKQSDSKLVDVERSADVAGDFLKCDKL